MNILSYSKQKRYDIPRHWWVSEKIYTYVQGLAKWQETSDNTYRFFIYVLYYSYFRRKHGSDSSDKREVHIPASWIETHIGQKKKKPDYDWLALQGLMNWSKHQAGICAVGYYIMPEILDKIEAYGVSGAHTHCLFSHNVWDMARCRKPIIKSILYDEQKHAMGSDLVRQAIKVLTGNISIVNMRRLECFWNRLNKPIKHAKEAGIPVAVSDRWVDRWSSLGAFIHNVKQENIDKGNGMWGYHPAYSIASSGRIFELGGGLQGLSKAIRKRALYEGDVINYDLSASQLRILAWMVGDTALAGMIPNIYKQMQEWKYPKDIVKKAIYGYLFNAGHEKNDGMKQLFAHRRHRIFFRSFLRLLHPFQDAIHRAIDIIMAQKITTQKRGAYWQNACDLIVTEAELINEAETEYESKIELLCRGKKAPWRNIINRESFIDAFVKRKLLAFYIQGIESYIIHRITVQGEKYGFVPISNQHDGLLVAGANNASDGVMLAVDEVKKDMNIEISLEMK